MPKRPVDVLVLSDIHLGSYGCNAEELDRYLKSVQPKTLILNGDIVDMWQFKKYFFPAAHLRVLKRIVNMMTKGTTVYYLTGNHDENLRRFSDMHAGSLHLVDKLLLNIDGKQVWFFHGDVFDVTMRYSKWVAKMGGAGYNSLILLNRAINLISASLGYGKISLSKKIKDSVKSAIRFVDDFEQTAIDLALENGYNYVVCGHIHRPAIRKVVAEKGEVIYMNSGDWIENLTALEYNEGAWRLFRYEQDFVEEHQTEEHSESAEATEAELISKEIPKVDLSDMKLEDLFQPADIPAS
jgi:UDP-2,3-diacylglucosamine pyrophosphatase LpxH